MKPTEKIFKLIEEGDSIPILAEAALVDCFNQLLQYELIDIVDEKVILTPKGETARIVGLDQLLYEFKLEEELKEFSPEVQKREDFKFRWVLAICLSLIAFIIAVGLTDCTVNL